MFIDQSQSTSSEAICFTEVVVVGFDDVVADVVVLVVVGLDVVVADVVVMLELGCEERHGDVEYGV
ncbi:MAG: hypothetical protein K2G14_06910, partial [Ruminococcus sp.]|nr:hypothetical protein [Ruminococcus sp.]